MDRPRLLTWQRSPVGPGSSSILGHDQLHAPASITPSHPRSRDLPRFGRGSNSCAGSEKRTEAISVTPTNLDHYCISVLLLFVVFVLRSYPGPQVAHILAENREKSLQLGRLIGNLLRHSSRCHVLSGGGGVDDQGLLEVRRGKESCLRAVSLDTGTEKGEEKESRPSQTGQCRDREDVGGVKGKSGAGRGGDVVVIFYCRWGERDGITL